MSNDPLKSFKIGDRRPPTVASGQRGAPTAKAAGGGSQALSSATGGDSSPDEGMRFERLEEVLDHEDPRDLGTRLAKMLTDLEAFAADHASARDKAAAKHARQAIERTIDLLDHLFKVREALAHDSLQEADAQGPAGAATPKPGPKTRPPTATPVAARKGAQR